MYLLTVQYRLTGKTCLAHANFDTLVFAATPPNGPRWRNRTATGLRERFSHAHLNYGH